MPSARATKPRIRVELIGGLGNQMFQAAAGIAAAARIGGLLELDISRLGGPRARRFSLDAMPHDAAVVDHKRDPFWKMKKLAHSASRVVVPNLSRPIPDWSGPVYVEPHFHFDPAVLSISGSCYLQGYFQSPKYFAGAESRIRRAFDLTACVSEAAINTSKRFGEADVAVHIRRGDFVADSRARQVHGVLDWGYYQAALKVLEQQARVQTIHMFSDDLEYARSIFLNDKRIVFQRGLSEHDDMFLMSRVRRHVIANSTFSWWSAWLDERPDATVVAPKAWFTSQTLTTKNLKDLFPEAWIIL